MLCPLVTTADEDAQEEEAAATARAAAAEAARAAAAGAEAAAAAQEQEDSWSIAAVGSPLAAQCSRLPPIVITHAATAGGEAVLSPRLQRGTPRSHGVTPSALARTTSAATTAFFSVRSTSSLAALASSSPYGAQPLGSQPRSALFRQASDAAAASPAASTMCTPRSAVASAAQQQQQQQQVGQAVQILPAMQPVQLFKQASNMSQALNGFETSILEGSVSGGC